MTASPRGQAIFSIMCIPTRPLGVRALSDLPVKRRYSPLTRPLCFLPVGLVAVAVVVALAAAVVAAVVVAAAAKAVTAAVAVAVLLLIVLQFWVFLSRRWLLVVVAAVVLPAAARVLVVLALVVVAVAVCLVPRASRGAKVALPLVAQDRRAATGSWI